MAGSYVNLPNYPYTAEIQFPFHFINKTDGSIGVRDDGSAYDKRVCKFDWDIKVSIADTWSLFLKDKNRYNAFNIQVSPEVDFYPFGPDYKLDQIYSVKLLNLANHGQIAAPYKFHNFEVEMQLNAAAIKDVPTSNSICTEPGTITLGDIDRIRFPKDLWKPEVVYSFRNVNTRNGSVYQIQPGNEADYQDTVLNVMASKDKAAMLIDHIINDIRANNFNLVVGSNNYPFGFEQGDNKTFVCKLNQSVISIKHNRYNEFEFDLRLRRIL